MPSMIDMPYALRSLPSIDEPVEFDDYNDEIEGGGGGNWTNPYKQLGLQLGVDVNNQLAGNKPRRPIVEFTNLLTALLDMVAPPITMFKDYNGNPYPPTKPRYEQWPF